MPPQRPADIGPYYRAIGFFALAVLAAFLLIGAWQGKAWTWVDAALLGIVALVVLALIRPLAFDRAVKNIAHWLPFTSYRKPDA